MFSLIYILVIGIVSNTGTTAINNINNQLSKIQCPSPLYHGQDQGNGTVTYVSFLNYGTFYQCAFCNTCVPTQPTITESYVNYNATVVNFPSGWFQYLGDTFTSYMFKVGAIVNLLGYILTPINFNILGYTISSLTGIALMFVIFSYIIAYLGIGIMAYKVVSPFSGGS